MLMPYLGMAQKNDVAVFRLKYDGEKERLELKPFDFTTTEKMTVSVSSQEDEMSIKTTEVMKDDIIYNLHGKRSKNHFKREVTLRIYFNEGTAYSIDNVYIGAFDLRNGNRCVVQQTPEGDELSYPKDAGLPSPQGRYYEIAENIYEITVSGVRGDYYLLLIDPETGRYNAVYDFRLR